MSNLVSSRPAPSSRKKPRDDDFAIPGRRQRRPQIFTACEFRFDERRKAWIVLAPERLLMPDEQAVAILHLIDGKRDVDTIIDELAGQFDAPPGRRHRRRSAANAAGSRRQEGFAAVTSTSCVEVEPPLALLAELTHRCPLRCPYCSNPLELSSRASTELDTASWRRVFTEAAALGVLQVHFSVASHWCAAIWSNSSPLPQRRGSTST